MRILSLFLTLIMSLGWSSAVWSQSSTSGKDGQSVSEVLLLNFQYRDGKVTFTTASILPGPMKEPKELPPESWQVQVLNADQRPIYAARFPNPTQLLPPPAQPEGYSFTVRVPHLPNGRLVALSDEHGRLLYSMPLSADTLTAARSRGEKILEALKLNQERLQEYYRRYGKKNRLVSSAELNFSESAREAPWQFNQLDQEERELRLMRLAEQFSEVQEDLLELKKLETGTKGLAVALPPGRLVQGGGTLSGKVRGPDGSGVYGVSISAYDQDTGLFTARTTSAFGGFYSMQLPAGTFSLRAVPPTSSRLLPGRIDGVTISGNRTLDFSLVSGFFLSGVITDDHGWPVGSASLTARDQATGKFINSGRTNAQGQYSVLVTSGTVKVFVYPPSNSLLYGKLIKDIQVAADTPLNVSLSPGLRLSGTISDVNGNRVSQGTVYAVEHETQKVFGTKSFQAGGTYSLTLASGEYDLYFTPSSSTRLLAKRIEGVSILSDTTLDVTLDSPGFVLSGFVRDRTGATVANCFIVANEEATSAFYASTSSSSNGAYSLLLPRGRYRLTLYPPAGFMASTTKAVNVTVEGDRVLDLTLNPGRLFEGRLVSTSGSSIGPASIFVYDDANSLVRSTSTSPDGRFSTIIPTSGRIFITPPANTNLIADAFDIKDLEGEPPYEMKLREMPQETGTDQLTHIFGDAETNNRVNIVFIGDGYTGTNETFTDTNGNGQWDGDILLDLNGNGRYDSGEPYRDRNGNRQYDPPEPFNDTNGDGIFNFNEQGLYDRNVMDYARLLLGIPPWKEYARFINIYKIRLISRQAGGDFPDITVPFFRDTPLDTKFGGTDYRLQASNDKATEIVQALVPHFDYIVILCHSPWGVGRANAYFGGSQRLIGGDFGLVSTVITHEFGHAFGFLADEYIEGSNLIYPYPSDEPLGVNVTTVTDRDKIKWRDLIAEDTPIPSPNEALGVGLFEGGHYYAVGAYRPQYNCMMRFNTPRYCAVCLRQMIKRFQVETGAGFPLDPGRMAQRIAHRLSPTTNDEKQDRFADQLMKTVK